MECASARNTEEEEVSNKLLKDIGYGQAVDFDSTTNKRKVEDLKLPSEWTKYRFRICQRACGEFVKKQQCKKATTFKFDSFPDQRWKLDGSMLKNKAGIWKSDDFSKPKRMT